MLFWSQPTPLHPKDPLKRAQNRAWIEFGSATLNDIGGFYNAKDTGNFAVKTKNLSDKFERLEKKLGDGPYFDGEEFNLVDAAFGPIFRYFDVFDRINDFGILTGKPKVQAWRKALAMRPSIIAAADPEYNALLLAFLKKRDAHLSTLIAA